MNESLVYKKLKEKMIMHGDRIDRVENFLTPGTPDVNLCVNGVESWLEIKSPIEPLDERKPLFKCNHKISIAQKNWAFRQIRAKGRVFYLIATNKRWILISGKFADYINEMPVYELVENSLWSCTLPLKKFDFLCLREMFYGGFNARK